MSGSAVGYLRIASLDNIAWMDFATNVLGLMDARRAVPTFRNGTSGTRRTCAFCPETG